MQMTKVQGLNWSFRKFRGELALLGKSSGTLLPILPNINVGDVGEFRKIHHPRNVEV
jgi:hypothetical protein